MLRLNALALALQGIVGWRESAGDSCVEALTPALTESRSGLYLNDLNELVTLPLLQELKPEKETLPAFLQRITDDTLKTFVAEFANERKLSAKTLLPTTPLFSGLANRANAVNPLGRFVGFQLNLRNRVGVATQVPRIGLQLDALLTQPLPIYVYRSDQPDAMLLFQVQSDSGDRANFVKWVELTAQGEGAPTGPYDVSAAAEPDVTLYIGYYEDDLLDVRALYKDFTAGPCGCPGDPYESWKDYAWPRAISVPAESLDADRLLFDTSAVRLESQSFGLNLELLSYCDLLTALTSEENQERLAPCVQLALGIRMLSVVLGSTTITQHSQRADIQADAYALLTQYEARLWGGKDLSTPDVYYPSMVKNVDLGLSGLDSKCQEAKRDRVSVASLNG
ncbi:hypothetical protein [Hymenobacter guriensis]|uniref:Uncharacterized protein n=1 Tax=Hymenobacter guriensis TaxID=2793065 RepID=A0ABS0L7N6_9BACT|nr:hypothetical protein [Hymenobacter guriensis]MBG8556164.1 hypothetical protein [Hymenobacter guriensis]